MVGIADGINVRDLWEEKAVTRADEEFLVFENPDTGEVRIFTYAKFWSSTCRVANMFWTRGVRSGDRVGVHLYNSVETLQCLFGLAAIGAITVPLNASYTPSEIDHILRSCQVRTVVTDPELLPSCLQADYGVRDAIVVGGAQGHPCYEELSNAEPDELRVRPPIAASDPIEVMFTSGTTSRPKGVVLTHHNFIFSGLFVNWELAMSPADRYLTTMATSHINLQTSALMPVLTAGATLVLQRRYSASRFWAEVRRHHATLVQGMAMIVRTLMAQPVHPDERDHQVREMHYFLPITEPEKQAFEARYQVSLLNNYGSTETLVGNITDLPFGKRRWPSIGRVGLGYQVKIVDAEGRQLPAGEMGEIMIKGERGRTLMAGYWQDEQATAQAFDADGWLHTSDYGYFDADGWFYFVDRQCDLIKRAGENVSASEVEDVLLRHPAVKEAAVVGIPDPVRDESVAAFVVLADDLKVDPEELIEHCKTHLAYFKVPTVVEIREQLPRGNYGKVQKKLLVNQERKCHDNQD